MPSPIRSLLLVLLLLAEGGCLTVPAPASCQEQLKGGLGLELGDRVVARWRDELFEATVVNVQGRLVTVAWDSPPPERSYFSRGAVQPVTTTERPKAGEPGLCGVGGAWILCQVEAAAASGIRVTEVWYGATQLLPREQVLPVPARLRSWARQRVDESLRRQRAAREIAGGGPATAGQPVSAGQRVIAEWIAGSWWEARVSAQQGTQLTVAWADGSGEMTLPASRVAPIPEASSTPRPTSFSAGDLAYCAWASGQAWYPARVDRVAKDALSVTYQDGTIESLGPTCCIPARRATKPV